MVERVSTKKGKRIKDDINVIVGGQAFDGWERITVTENLDSIANQFSMNIFDKFAALKEDWPFKPGVSIQINTNGEKTLTGRVEKLDVNFTDKDRGYVISGRSKPGDLVDCTHTGPNEYKNIGLKELAEELVAPFGLQVFLSVTPAKIAKFSVKPGETVFEALDRAARTQGFFFVSTREGNIRLTRAARARAVTSLEQDVNIWQATAVYDDSKRHDEYIVKGQRSGIADFFGPDVSQPEGKAFDLGIKRHRPFTMIAESSVDSAQAETRAQWEASLRLADSIDVGITVQGWTQRDGTLWGINQVIPIRSRFLGLNRDLLIKGLTRVSDKSEGTTTLLNLTDPKAYDPEPQKNKDAKDDIFAALGANF